jgi:hypothetical protein
VHSYALPPNLVPILDEAPSQRLDGRGEPPDEHRGRQGAIASRTAMALAATLDTGNSLFFDHRDPAMVSRLGTMRVND